MDEIYIVTKIIDSKNIVINAGKNNYIKKGDKFEIFVKGDELFDINTKESLGTLDTIKETVTVVTVFQKMCICQKLVKTSPLAIASLAANSLTSKVEAVDLNVDSSQQSGGFSQDLIIHIGDLARLTD